MKGKPVMFVVDNGETFLFGRCRGECEMCPS
jgi:hypothetical protein